MPHWRDQIGGESVALPRGVLLPLMAEGEGGVGLPVIHHPAVELELDLLLPPTLWKIRGAILPSNRMPPPSPHPHLLRVH
jgi:hypothetical protein